MKRGGVWHVDLDPVAGHEQSGKRFVLIVSPHAFNAAMGVSIVVPITTGGTFARSRGFTVSLTGAGTRTIGVVPCGQPRTLDMAARRGRFVETVPDVIVDDVLAKVSAILE